jgi:hypothetical protein
MPRPGCVWSHVLLLDLTDLARIRDLSVLRELCLRPAVPPDLSTYKRPLSLLARDTAAGTADLKDQFRAACLLPAVYGQPQNGVVVLDEKSSFWEVIVFALWSQQWPRLRRTFAFSTGSLGDRRLGGVAFDLQIGPLSSQRLWGRDGLPTVVLEDPSGALPPTLVPWVRTAVDDLFKGTNGALRQFLFSYGSDVEKPRHAFVRLVECFDGPPSGEEDGPHGQKVCAIRPV